jgi:hypothetical protein
MRWLLRLEEIALVALAVWLFYDSGLAWWWLPILFVLVDVSMVGYLFGPRAGAATYNFVHHRLLAVIVYVIGALLEQSAVQAVGAVLLLHSAVDRALGFGLKHKDSFQHTHLAQIGR